MTNITCYIALADRLLRVAAPSYDLPSQSHRTNIGNLTTININ